MKARLTLVFERKISEQDYRYIKETFDAFMADSLYEYFGVDNKMPIDAALEIISDND